MQGVTSVDTELDGVVYENGTFIGPDRTRIRQRYLMARFAARDEALEALKFIKSSTVSQSMIALQLLQTLHQEIQRDGRASQRDLLGLYVADRGKCAQDIRRILGDRGLPDLEKFIEMVFGHSLQTASPSVFGKEYLKLKDNDPRVFAFTP